MLNISCEPLKAFRSSSVGGRTAPAAPSIDALLLLQIQLFNPYRPVLPNRRTRGGLKRSRTVFW